MIGYLLRLQPFTNNTIKLQSNKFDNPNRIFINFNNMYSYLEIQNDNREITPEFYYCPEFLVNKYLFYFHYSNLYYFGKRSDNIVVHDICLPEWANNPVDFIHKHRLVN